MPEGHDEDPAANFDEDEVWLDDNIKAAIENLLEILYDAGCSVNGTIITVPALPGAGDTFGTDYGYVHIKPAEVA